MQIADIYVENLKQAGLEKFKHWCGPRILCCVALVYSSYFFSEQPFYGKLFDIRFSYKHCNFSSACLLVKREGLLYFIQGKFPKINPQGLVLDRA